MSPPVPGRSRLTTDSMRLFVGVPLDASLRSAAERIREEIVRVCPEAARRVKWVEPHNLHFTLKFLGEIPEADLENVVRAVESSRGSGAFEIDIEGVGAFPGAGSARVLWAGVSGGADRLVALATLAEDALSAVGFPRDTRPFSPHLTLGRV